MQKVIIEPLYNIEYAYFNNTKLAHEVLNNNITASGKFQNCNVFDDVAVRAAIRHKDKKDFKFEAMDVLILDAVGTLYDNGIYYFNTDTVTKIIFHDIHHRVTPETIKKFKERIALMSELKIRLDIEEELNARESIPKDNRLQKKQYTAFLPLKEVDAVFSANGKQGKGYHLYRSPILWEYAKYTKQITKARFGSFNIRSKHMTVEALLILRYINKHIELMKNKNNNMHSRKISLYRVENHIEKGLLPACGIYKSDFKHWSDKRRKIREWTEAFLEELKNTSDTKFKIKAYVYYKNRSGEGYHIELCGKKYKVKKEN